MLNALYDSFSGKKKNLQVSRNAAVAMYALPLIINLLGKTSEETTNVFQPARVFALIRTAVSAQLKN